jgi:phage shock protein E
MSQCRHSPAKLFHEFTSSTMKYPRIVVLVAILLAALSAGLSAADHTKDSLETVKKNVASSKAVLVDVREQSEWDEGHIADAVLVPLSMLKDGKKPDSLAKDKIAYLHCKSGRRCLTAADILKKLGYEVRPLKAGYEDLLKAGFKKADE